MRLKSLGLAAVVIATLSFTAHAETRLGVESGLNFGSLNANLTAGGSGLTIGSDTQTNFVGGVFLEQQITENFFIQPELMYLFQYTDLQYVTAPILAKGKVLIPESPVSLFAELGPELGIKTKGSGYNSVNLGLVIGAGPEIAISPSISLLVDVRYVIGITHSRSASGDLGGTSIDATVTNRALQLMGGISFGL